MKIDINYNVINSENYTSKIECTPREFVIINENKASNNDSEISDQFSVANTPKAKKKN